jgi:hypothetical protein
MNTPAMTLPIHGATDGSMGLLGGIARFDWRVSWAGDQQRRDANPGERGADDWHDQPVRLDAHALTRPGDGASGG